MNKKEHKTKIFNHMNTNPEKTSTDTFFFLSLADPFSLSLDFAQTQTQTQTYMPQAPLSNQWVSLFGILFLWVSVHMVLPTCRGEVEGMGLWGSAWWRFEFVD